MGRDLISCTSVSHFSNAVAIFISRLIDNTAKLLLLKMSEVEYWTNYYSTLGNVEVPTESSTFAKFTSQWLAQNEINMSEVSIVDLGCGTGRDSRFFASLGAQIIGVDQVKQNLKIDGVQYVTGDLANLHHDIVNEESVDIMYCRFVIHSLEKEDASNLYKWVQKSMKSGGLFFIEARSIADPLYLRGERNHVDPNVSVYGHFRRFIILDELIEELRQLGMEILYHCERDNLSIHRDDNPVLVRLVCRK